MRTFLGVDKMNLKACLNDDSGDWLYTRYR